VLYDFKLGFYGRLFCHLKAPKLGIVESDKANNGNHRKKGHNLPKRPQRGSNCISGKEGNYLSEGVRRIKPNHVANNAHKRGGDESARMGPYKSPKHPD
jgi:hypothetical protein